MKILLEIAMAFIAPLAGIAVFIAIDRAIDGIGRRLKKKRSR